MRLTYVLAVVIAATLHASGAALDATKDSNPAVISNVAAIDTVQENGGRMLRKVREDELDEERGGFSSLNSWLKQKGVMAKHQLKAHFNPMSQEWKLRKALNNAKRIRKQNKEFARRFQAGLE